MEQDQKQAHARRSGLTYAAADAFIAVAIFAIGVVMMIDNYKIGAGWAKSGPESGYFPFRIGAILCIASLVVLLKALLSKDRKIFVTWDRLKLVLLVLLPTTVYVLAVQFAGIYVASTLFIGAFMRLMGKYSWLKTLLVSIGINVTLFWMFEKQFMVPLPKGPLEALFGY